MRRLIPTLLWSRNVDMDHLDHELLIRIDAVTETLLMLRPKRLHQRIAVKA